MTKASNRRRDALWSLLVVLVVACVAAVLVIAQPAQSSSQSSSLDGASEPTSTTTATTSSRPNVVLITTDDQTLSDLQFMAKTKNLLGDGGMTFPHMLSPHPLCCPARAEILTGEFAQTNGVRSNEGPWGGYPSLKDPGNTIGTWLHDAGYKTAVVGKFLNKWVPRLGIPAGWDYWQTSVKSEFGYYGFTMDRNGKNIVYPKDGGAYSTDVVSTVTDRLIDAWAPSSPFFIWSSYYAPHGLCGEQEGCRHPPTPAHQYADYPVDANAPSIESPSFDEQDVSDKPRLIQKQPLVSATFAQETFTQRIRALQSVDDAVKSTLDTLDANGVLNNTYVMFTSDNGYLIGEHRYIGKILPYEESLKVPLLVRGPGIAPGSVAEPTVTTVDLAATISDMTGVTPGREQDGDSLLPMLTGGPAPDRDATLIQAGGLGSGPLSKPWLYRGIRTERYTFSLWRQDRLFAEMYDRKVDPYELVNVAQDPRYAAIAALLRDRLKTLSACTGAACNTEFGPLPEPLARPLAKGTPRR